MAKKHYLKYNCLWILLAFLGFITLFACQLPGRILDSVSQQSGATQSSPGLTSSPVAYPQPGDDPFYSTSNSNYPEPGSQIPSPPSSTESAYPGPGVIPTPVAAVPTVLTTDYPGPQISPNPIETLEEPTQGTDNPVLDFTNTSTPLSTGTQAGACELSRRL
jgi:hypothetical protein